MSKIIIDSRDRLSGSTSTTDFRIKLPEAIKVNSTIRIVDLIIPRTFYTFGSSNSTITFDEVSTADQTATITSGSYTTSELTSHLKTILDAASTDGQTYTVSYDNNTMKITIACDANVDLRFSETNSPYYELGFSNADTGAGTSHVASNVIQLQGHNYLYIDLNNTNDEVRSSSSADSGTFYFPFVGSRGDITSFSDNSYKQSTKFKQGANYLHVKVKGRGNSVISLNGADFIMTLDVIPPC